MSHYLRSPFMPFRPNELVLQHFRAWRTRRHSFCLLVSREEVVRDPNNKYHTFERLVGIALTVLLILALVGIMPLAGRF